MPRGAAASRLKSTPAKARSTDRSWNLRCATGWDATGAATHTRQSANIYSSAYHLASARIGRGIG
jgi:hypothetical protein